MGDYQFQDRQPQVMKDNVYLLGEAIERAPELKGVPTGVKGFDELFFKVEWEEGKPVKKPLGGIPEYAVVNLTGMPDTGKSLMAEQFTVKQASLGQKVCFVTVESPAAFVAAGLKQRATAMGIDFEEIENNIILIDAASNSKLRDDIPTMLDTLAYVYRTYHCRKTVIDSITGLFEAKEMLARSIVRAFFNFMKKWYQTAIFVSQKRSGHDELSAEAAGGYAVGHIVDCTVVLSKEILLSPNRAKAFKKELGDILRILRIDGCRLCGHDTRLHLMEITELGLVEVKEPLVEYLKGAK
ncbi:putative circadian clock protein, KaiC [Desulfurobacterium thermolithotrophum DSM 11699]|uniref:Putative circadian clock protein, KaiC n=1 Tax=Desulfurobacterium thermolithotrophum (strain DSM 11699 / BSA) TaxID=868864 RepID=F0S020_DESTD|nr:KaiC domain-containing protein [Desulfurobacterium thermolithotrophum]ADY73701.1 putative circadian clock protein, KaiC [Desulfurobacterium thermolithotrophum DSM 11699]